MKLVNGEWLQMPGYKPVVQLLSCSVYELALLSVSEGLAGIGNKIQVSCY